MVDLDSLFQFELLLLGSVVILLGIHTVTSRILIYTNTSLSPQVVAFLSILICYFIVGFSAWFVYLKQLTKWELWCAILYAFLVYSGFAYSYFHFFNMSETARRIKVLCILFFATSLGIGELKTHFVPGDQISNRLERLIALGQVKKFRDRFTIRSRFLWAIAVTLLGLKRILRF